MTKEQLRDVILELIEILDDKIPYVGPFMDLPAVDAAEKSLVDALLSDCTVNDDAFMAWSA